MRRTKRRSRDLRRRDNDIDYFSLYSNNYKRFGRRSSARSNLRNVVVLCEFAQLFVKLTNFILVRFTRHILNHARLVRLLVRFLVRLLRLGSRIHVPGRVRASAILSVLFPFKNTPSRRIVSTPVEFHVAKSCIASLSSSNCAPPSSPSFRAFPFYFASSPSSRRHLSRRRP